MSNHKSLAPIDQDAVDELVGSDNTISDISRAVDRLMRKVPPKRRKFIREYMVDGNGGKAAIRAGYAVKSSMSTASLIISDPTISIIVRLLEEKHQLQTGISASWKRRRLKDIIEMTVAKGDDFQPGTAVKAINELNLMDGSHKPKLHHVTSESVSVNLNYQIDMPAREGAEKTVIEGEPDGDNEPE